MRFGTASLERWRPSQGTRRGVGPGVEKGGPDGAMSGAGFMLLAMAGFTINDALVKGLGDALPVAQVIVVRGAILLALMIAFFTVRSRAATSIGSPSAPMLDAVRRAASHPLVLVRSVCELLATIAFLLALVRLPFAVISSMLQSMPLVVTAGAALLLGESVGWRRWLAILLGLIGVLIILRPGGNAFEGSGLLFAVVCVLLSAGRDLCTRRIPADVPSLGVTMVSVLLMTFCSLVWCISTGTWSAMNGSQLALMAGAALFLFAGMQGIVLAMRTGDVAAIMPFRYTGLVWAVALGWLFYAEVPDGWTLMGGAIVVGTGLYAFARERRIARAD